MYAMTAQDAVQSVLAGYNATVLAYGQTGSGKTFTMEGYDDVELQGLIPRAVSDLFHLIHSTSSPSSHFLVRASYIQIYNESITDLLMAPTASSSGGGSSGLLIREDAVRGVFVGGLSEWVVRNVREVMELLRRGTGRRATSATKMNESSSRSHAVFIINVEQQNNRQPHTPTSSSSSPTASVPAPSSSFLSAKLNLVDLAGSERITLSGAKGARLEETKAINQSLSALANVIAALIKHRPHIPYRDSKLTRLLQSSIGGNTRTCLLTCLSPSPAHYNENVSSLSFASRARRVQNRVEVNEVGVDGRPSVLRKYERELTRLRAELQQRRENVVDVRRLIAAEDEKRKAEADREEQRGRVKALSESLVKEKALKRRLQQQIEQMNGVMIAGGGKSREMEQRVQELQERWEEAEREREKLRAERANSGQYEQLVEAQREVIRRMSAGMEKKEEERRTCEEQLHDWQAKCRAMEREYDRMEARYLRLNNRLAERDGAVDDDDEEEDEQSEEASVAGGVAVAGNRYSVIVTPYENDDSELRDGDEDDHIDGTTSHYHSSSPRSPSHQSAAYKRRDEHGALRRQCRRQEEERAALLVILEQKMASMVDNIDHCIAQHDDGEQARQEVDKLRRLLAASITALRYAQNDKSAYHDEEKEETEQEEEEEAAEELTSETAALPSTAHRAAQPVISAPPPPPQPRAARAAPASPSAVSFVLPSQQRTTTKDEPTAWSPFPVSPSPLSPAPLSPAPASPSTPSAPPTIATLESLQASLRAGREDFVRLQQRLAQR